uniref:Uncharacterized protein n=1 Tax=Candidatus Methanogaster sp. ANME-2c ERB4 TaxID=2759911 RepID=A0A7G9YNI1_9EURY|nr:hypothetical protein IDCAPMJN_00001 [Methanosarcinales archaeon ANME-2c ERB4]
MFSFFVFNTPAVLPSETAASNRSSASSFGSTSASYSTPSIKRLKPEMNAESGIRNLNSSSVAVSCGFVSFSSMLVIA